MRQIVAVGLAAALIAAACSSGDDLGADAFLVTTTVESNATTTTAAAPATLPLAVDDVDLPEPATFELEPSPTSTTTTAPSTTITDPTDPSDPTDPTDPSDPTDVAPDTTVASPPGPAAVSVLDRLPDLTGETITIIGPEVDGDADSFEAGIAPFEAATGAEVIYTGTPDETVVIADAIEAGTPPDLAVIAQPGRLLDLAQQSTILPVPQSIVDTVQADFDPFWAELVTRRGRTYGVPNRASVKSLVWYSPEAFVVGGYEVPTTWDELLALQRDMRANDDTPWCIGISSGEATGWVFTDWIEDAMLRLHGPDVYDDWVTHEIGFDDDRVVAAVELVSDIWFETGNVLGARDDIASTTFAAAGLPLLDDDCLMHRQASFYSGNYTAARADLGPDGDVDVFYLPTISDDFGKVVLGAGNYLAPFTDRTATYALLAYFASADYANARISSGLGGFVSPNLRSDSGLYPSEVEAEVADILLTADPFRFDASDLMPAAVGADEFWRASTALVTGAITAQDLVDRVEAAWPTR